MDNRIITYFLILYTCFQHFLFSERNGELRLEELTIQIQSTVPNTSSDILHIKGVRFSMEEIDINAIPEDELTDENFLEGGYLYQLAQTPLESFKLYRQIIKSGEIEFAIKNLIALEDNEANPQVVKLIKSKEYIEHLKRIAASDTVKFEPILMIQERSDLIKLFSWKIEGDSRNLSLVTMKKIKNIWKMLPSSTSEEETPTIMQIYKALDSKSNIEIKSLDLE